jgi:cytosine/adenosine deaminase-related metal-dependent hydrolase
MTDILIRGGTVVAMDEARRVIEDGAVAITGDRIAAVGPRAEVEAAHGGAATIIEAKGRAILPGLIDAHAHAGHALVKTMGGGDSAAWSEACRIIYTTASPPSFWRAEARLAALERLKNGVTTGVSLLGGGDSIMRVDDPAHGEAHAAGGADAPAAPARLCLVGRAAAGRLSRELRTAGGGDRHAHRTAARHAGWAHGDRHAHARLSRGEA